MKFQHMNTRLSSAIALLIATALLLLLSSSGNTAARVSAQQTPTRQFITVISDLHIGSPWLATTTRIDLLRNFLTQFTFANTTHTMIIAGDLLENWLDAFNVTPFTLAQTLQQTNLYNASIPEFMGILKKIVDNGIALVYTIGNHDDFMTREAFSTFNISVTFTRDAYVYKNMRIEHGHYYDIFNAPDPVGGPNSIMRSLGYYVARAVTTSGRSSTTSSLTKFLCELFVGNTLVVDILRYDALSVFERVVDNALGGDAWSNFVLGQYNKYRRTNVNSGCYYTGTATSSSSNTTIKFDTINTNPLLNKTI